MLGGDEQWLPQPETVHRTEIVVGIGEVHFVDDDLDRLAAAPKHLGDALVERRHAGAAVEYEEDQRGGGDGEIDLLLGGFHELLGRIVAGQSDAAGVEKRVRAFFDLGGDDVAGDARLVMDDGNAFPRQAIKQATFAHIGASDDGDGAIHKGPAKSFRPGSRA